MQQGTFDHQQITVFNTRSKVRIATCNVRIMQPGKLENIEKEANRMDLVILGLAEVRWLKSWKLLNDEHMLIYSGDIKEHKDGRRRRRNKFIMTHDSYKILQHKNKQN